MLVSTGWLAERLSDSKLLVLHVGQGRKKYDAGHITGARFLEYNDIVATRDGVINELPPVEKLQQVFSQLGLGDDMHVVLTCDMQGLLAARVYWTLDYLGFGENAALLDGGMEKWKEEKRALSVAVPEVQVRRFTPHLNPKVLVSREVVKDVSWLNANSEFSSTVLLDAREPEAYSGEYKSKNLTVSGHIPGAANVYWMDTLTSKELATLKPAADLRRIYAGAGAGPGNKVVTYCWIGMMASHGYFVLKYLGYDVAMYDGSFTDWVKSEGTSVIQGKNRKQQ
jgi:thiosulfate/3-mercaptopyruvate sulfurtransferase